MTVKRQLLSFGARSVDVRYGLGGVDELSRLVKSAVGKPNRALLVHAADLDPALVTRVRHMLSDAGFTYEVHAVELPEGPFVPLDAVGSVCDACAAAGITADDLVIATGDARICSLAALAAKLWQGGCACVLVPTTLDAMITAPTALPAFDTAGSHGMLWHLPEPQMVVSDVALLHDASAEDLAFGRVLIVGAFMADSRRAWEHLGELMDGLVARDDAALLDAFATTQTARRAVLSAANPSARHALEYGVTTARALRRCLGPEVPWWRLLAEGMRFEARLAVDAASMSVDDVFEQDDRLDDLGIEELPFSLGVDEFVAAIDEVRARHSNRRLFALPKHVGSIRLTAVKDDVLARHAEAYLASRAELLAG